ncbi:hypothetical protein CTheo_9128 [Ceratobasidium theobromae]|uniref:Transmembrane protein n=1 Tax=Ceratobasidium theobromae TaxID=1582974 RepID=A0A5N5Q6M5_9AGAM|nr:hypothetical protein CTheo_9128 [Ceratobasidium theobromae]
MGGGHGLIFINLYPWGDHSHGWRAHTGLRPGGPSWQVDVAHVDGKVPIVEGGSRGRCILEPAWAKRVAKEMGALAVGASWGAQAHMSQLVGKFLGTALAAPAVMVLWVMMLTTFIAPHWGAAHLWSGALVRAAPLAFRDLGAGCVCGDKRVAVSEGEASTGIHCLSLASGVVHRDDDHFKAARTALADDCVWLEEPNIYRRVFS